MTVNGKTKWIALVVGILTMLTAGGTIVLRVLNVESKEESAAGRDAIKMELRGEIKAGEGRHEKHEESLHKIEKDLAVQGSDIRWVKNALKDAGYRAE